jgi:hypothetical protein
MGWRIPVSIFSCISIEIVFYFEIFQKYSEKFSEFFISGKAKTGSWQAD